MMDVITDDSVIGVVGEEVRIAATHEEGEESCSSGSKIACRK